MIILCGGTKGGSGKSTLATHLCVLRSIGASGSDPKDVLLVDADDQETAYDFTALRNQNRDGGAGYTCIKLTGPSVRTEVLRLRAKYDDIIIDAGGRDTVGQRAAMAVADLLLVPFVPRSFDIWTLQKIGLVVEEMRPANPGLTAVTFISRADAQGSENEEAAQILKEVHALQFANTPISNRKAFGHAASVGLAVTELGSHPELKKRMDPKACAEIERLVEAVFAPNTGPIWGHTDTTKIAATGGA